MKLITVFVTYKDLAVQHLIVSEYVVEHLLVQILRDSLECYLHATSFLGLQIYVPDGSLSN